MLRYGVSHPVINDRNMVLWRDLGVSSWPTLMVVSPKGQVIATLAGAARCYILQACCVLMTQPVQLALHRLAVTCNPSCVHHAPCVDGCVLRTSIPVEKSL